MRALQVGDLEIDERGPPSQCACNEVRDVRTRSAHLSPGKDHAQNHGYVARAPEPLGVPTEHRNAASPSRRGAVIIRRESG